MPRGKATNRTSDQARLSRKAQQALQVTNHLSHLRGFPCSGFAIGLKNREANVLDLTPAPPVDQEMPPRHICEEQIFSFLISRTIVNRIFREYNSILKKT